MAFREDTKQAAYERAGARALRVPAAGTRARRTSAGGAGGC